MTENSTPDVGRAAIDAYLDSVEQALVAAHAPRSDRLQVLQDLESQIADMLAKEPLPLTEESVRSVIEKLEPPRHFADTYVNLAESTSTSTGRFARLQHVRWPLIAAVSCALLPMGCVLALLLLLFPGTLPLVGLAILLLWFVGLLLTPIALWKAYKQPRAQPGKFLDRDLVLKSTLAYGVLAPVLVMWVAIAATDGSVLFPLGIAALIYIQYMLIRHVWRYMTDALPPQPVPVSTGNANGNSASSPISSTAPMPAM